MNDIIELLNLKEHEVEEPLTTYRNNNTLFIDLKLKRKVEACPDCGCIENTIKGYYSRSINHPILNGIQCIVKYKARKYRCNLCHKIYYEKNNFVDDNCSYSKYAYLRVLDELKNPHNTFSDVARKCFMSVSNIVNIFDSLGIANRTKFPEILCIDEYHDPSTGIGTYNCIFMNFDNNQIVDVLPDRTKHYLHHYFQNIPKNELEKVKHISIDMWPAYRDIASIYFKNAIVSVDPFHVIEHVHKALTDVRIRIMKKYKPGTKEYYLLKKFNWLLHKNYCDLNYTEPKLNRKLNLYLNKHSTLDLILKVDEELKRAYNFKEDYYRFNKYSSLENAKEKLHSLIVKFSESGMEEFVKLSKTLSTWYYEIINSFTRYHGRRITNGPMESKNSKVKLVIKNSCGFTNFERERNRLFYCLNEYWSASPISPIRFIKRKGYKRGNYKKF